MTARPSLDGGGQRTATPSHRPRLLVLTPAADLYGSDRSLLVALPALQSVYDVTLVSASHGPLLAEAERLGVECVITPDWALRRRMLHPRAARSTVRQVRSTLAALRQMHAERPFIGIYANTIANAALPFLKRAVPAPLVVHIRELPRDKPTQLRALLGVVERHADSVVCNSEFTARTALEVQPRLADRTRVVLNSIPEPGRPPEPPPDDGRLHVSCVGRIHPKKGQEVLLRAAALATEAGAEWHLHFHGDALPEHAPLYASLRRLAAELGIEQRVTWHGYAADTDRLYDGVHVVTVPSVIPEEFSLVAGEAQRRSLPVVATGPGGPSEILVDGSTGRIVAPNDPADLAAAIRQLEDPAIRERWGPAGGERSARILGVDRYRAEVLGHVRHAVERRPSVLVVSPSADLYGSDRALAHALPGIVERHPVVVALAASGPFEAEARRCGAAAIVTVDFAARRRYLRARQLPSLAVRSGRALWTLRRLRRRHRAALVYVNTVAVPVIPLLRRVLRCPVLIHVHERALGGRREARLIRWGLAAGADAVVVNSAWTGTTLDGVAEERLTVVHNGIEPTLDPAPELERRRARRPGTIRIVCVARLHPKKGHDTLVDAIRLLIDRGIDAHLDLVGDALPEHVALEGRIRRQVADRKLTSHVTFHGYHPQPGPFYDQADVVVVPSAFPEEFSLVAAEGQMRGLAAVVTGPGGVSEVVAHDVTGIVVPPGRPAALADALARLAAHPDLAAEMGERGRQRMLERFTAAEYRCRIAAVVEATIATPTTIDPREGP